MESVLTWQDAKAQTQAMELEIAGLIPKAKVVKVGQKEIGTLFNCSDARHNWNGSTTVTLTKGTDPEPLVKGVETHYRASGFNVETDFDVVGDYRVQLRSPDTAESYIIVKDDPDTIRIASGSACFTLPEGVSSRGEF